MGPSPLGGLPGRLCRWIPKNRGMPIKLSAVLKSVLCLTFFLFYRVFSPLSVAWSV